MRKRGRDEERGRGEGRGKKEKGENEEEMRFPRDWIPRSPTSLFQAILRRACEALTYGFVMVACVTLTNTLLKQDFGLHNRSREVLGVISKEVLCQRKTAGRMKHQLRKGSG